MLNDISRSSAATVEGDIVFTTAPCLTYLRSTALVAPKLAGVLCPLVLWSRATSCSLKRLPWKRMSPARWRWRMRSYPKTRRPTFVCPAEPLPHSRGHRARESRRAGWCCTRAAPLCASPRPVRTCLLRTARGDSDAHNGFGDLADRRGLCGGAGTRSNVRSELPNLPTELRIGRLQDRM